LAGKGAQNSGRPLVEDLMLGLGFFALGQGQWANQHHSSAKVRKKVGKTKKNPLFLAHLPRNS